MTDLRSPPENPEQELAQARRLLRQFPPGSQLVSAQEIRRGALAVIREHRRRQSQHQQNQRQPQLPLT